MSISKKNLVYAKIKLIQTNKEIKTNITRKNVKQTSKTIFKKNLKNLNFTSL